ncbi:MAG: hypothetical protein ACYTE8_07995, partial [Planctomycetota bacterium]
SFCMAEYCDTPQSKEGSNREYEVCLSGRSILRLLDNPMLGSIGVEHRTSNPQVITVMVQRTIDT